VVNKITKEHEIREQLSVQIVETASAYGSEKKNY